MPASQITPRPSLQNGFCIQLNRVVPGRGHIDSIPLYKNNITLINPGEEFTVVVAGRKTRQTHAPVSYLAELKIDKASVGYYTYLVEVPFVSEKNTDGSMVAFQGAFRGFQTSPNTACFFKAATVGCPVVQGVHLSAEECKQFGEEVVFAEFCYRILQATARIEVDIYEAIPCVSEYPEKDMPTICNEAIASYRHLSGKQPYIAAGGVFGDCAFDASKLHWRKISFDPTPVARLGINVIIVSGDHDIAAENLRMATQFQKYAKRGMRTILNDNLQVCYSLHLQKRHIWTAAEEDDEKYFRDPLLLFLLPDRQEKKKVKIKHERC